MNERRKISANDIISGVDKSQEEDTNKIQPEDVKNPGGLHPIVADRLSRDRSEQVVQNPILSNSSQPKNDYVTREEMIRFVDNLNVQLAEISKWVNMVVQNDKTYKSAIMNIQGNLATLQGKVNSIYNRQ